jgi:serine/threonine protein kinase
MSIALPRWGPEGVLLKVIDYGLAAFCEPGQQMFTMIGTARYVAPEVSFAAVSEYCMSE